MKIPTKSELKALSIAVMGIDRFPELYTVEYAQSIKKQYADKLSIYKVDKASKDVFSVFYSNDNLNWKKLPGRNSFSSKNKAICSPVWAMACDCYPYQRIIQTNILKSIS